MESKDETEEECVKDDDNKLSKKASKKAIRALMILKKDTGIEESKTATLTIFVCNAGLVTGCSSSDLLNIFSKFGPITYIFMVPKKSYSFLVFANEASSKAAMDAIHGKVGFNEKGPLYLAFVDKPPDFKDPWKDHCLPNGLKIVPNFITQEQEKEILQSFDWEEKNHESILKHREVKHFGFEFSYKTNNIDPDLPLDDKIPDLCTAVAVAAYQAGLTSSTPDQLTVNKYLPGQGIPPHIDSHDCCTDTILSLSLGSGVTMEFRGPKGEHVPVWLPPRSLLIMSGEARYCWSHGITPRHCDTVPHSVLGLEQGLEGLTLAHRDTRVSLTFRKTFRGPCSCPYPEFCDRSKYSQLEKQNSGLNKADIRDKIEEAASLLESQLVHQVYEEIAGHFSETRHKPWPRVTQFVDSVESCKLLLDLGCGNGKYLGQADQVKWEIGADYSQNLLNIVIERGHQGVRCDLMNVPFKDGSVSGVICIAALHHLATEERRVEAVKEMWRVLEIGGRFLVYVWAKDQKKKEMSTYLKQNKNNFKKKAQDPETVGKNETGEFGLPVHVNRTQFQHQDVLVPWKLKQSEEQGGDKEFKRFYHVFEEGELEELVMKVDGLEVVEGYYDQGNWCCIAKKV